MDNGQAACGEIWVEGVEPLMNAMFPPPNGAAQRGGVNHCLSFLPSGIPGLVCPDWIVN